MRPVEHIRTISESVIEQAGCFLLDVVPEAGKETVYWILVDAEEEPVSLDTCGELSREIGFLLDAHEELKGRYRLNVSSPGLDRPLTDKRQYAKNIGRRIRLRLQDGSSEQGILREADTASLGIETDSGIRQHPFEHVREALIIPTINR